MVGIRKGIEQWKPCQSRQWNPVQLSGLPTPVNQPAHTSMENMLNDGDHDDHRKELAEISIYCVQLFHHFPIYPILYDIITLAIIDEFLLIFMSAM